MKEKPEKISLSPAHWLDIASPLLIITHAAFIINAEAHRLILILGIEYFDARY
jgi:hypothetical protein